MILDYSQYDVKFAQTEAERQASYHLRYQVFVKEMQAKVCAMCHDLQQEKDDFDAAFDHLILVDRSVADPNKQVVGVYRLLSQDAARKLGRFYGSSEYTLDGMLASPRKTLELGRSCLAKDHRGGIGLRLLWQALARHVLQNNYEILFGVASFAGTDASRYGQALSWLHHHALAPASLGIVAQADHAVPLPLLPADLTDRLSAMRQMPPLIKSYLRLGGQVGQNAFVDHQFNTVDMCMVLDTANMTPKQISKLTQAAG